MSPGRRMDGSERVETVIIGGGQAGLATGYHLATRGVPFVILDANERIGDGWRKRWDSLRLFTPARYDGLPGWPFPAPAWSFPTKDEVAGYLEAYAVRFDLPVRTGVRVHGLSREADRYVVAAGDRRFEADQVVVASGRLPAPPGSRLRRRARSGHRAAALQRIPGSIPAAGGRRAGRRRRQLGG
jgi:putative flavoprotein involved in K+ transport